MQNRILKCGVGFRYDVQRNALVTDRVTPTNARGPVARSVAKMLAHKNQDSRGKVLPADECFFFVDQRSSFCV